MRGVTTYKFTKEALEEEYCNKKKSIKKIAKEFKVCAKTIAKNMKEFGIKAKSTLDYKKVDLTSQKFGRLVAKEYAGQNKLTKSFWLCECECGNTKIVLSTHLRRGMVKSCGCLKEDMIHQGYKHTSASYWNRIIKSCEVRGLEFDIDEPYLWELYESQDRKCALTGLPIDWCKTPQESTKGTASIDRIDSKKGYIKGNIQIVHKIINRMKSVFTQTEFISFCTLVGLTFNQTREEAEKNCTRTSVRKFNDELKAKGK